MGAWSGEPFGNDGAMDWAFELADADDWSYVQKALLAAVDADDAIDEDAAVEAIAAAEVVAHGIGHATQKDAYTEGVADFAQRVSKPAQELVTLAVRALDVATGPGSGLTEAWSEDDPGEWEAANAALARALSGSAHQA